MSSKTQSSASSSPLPRSRPPPQSLIVSKVPIARNESWIFDDLSRNYADVKRVSRNHDQDGNELSSIRVDFNSDKVVSEILNDDEIYINNKAYYIRPYWPFVCYRCGNEGHVSSECPQNSLPEWRLAELIEEQKSNFENLLNGFENRWNTRLLKLKLPKTPDVTQLLPVVNDLTTVCQQLNQNNLRMQQQLSNIADRIQTMQTNVKN